MEDEGKGIVAALVNRHSPTMKLFGFAILWGLSIAHADVAVEVQFKPLPRDIQSMETTIRSHIIAATEEWASHFHTRHCTITVEFSIRPWPGRGTGRSFVSAPYCGEMCDGKHVSEEGAAQKIRTGADANGSHPDIEMYFDPIYFRTLWFDPDPKARVAPMPEPGQQKLDAFSVILHELGHAFGFNGFKDPKNGALPGEFMSVYDRWVTFDGARSFFNGPNAVRLYGRPIPLAHANTNYHHVGDKGYTTDPQLNGDLMNGITLEWSRRYYISPLDIAISSDCGLAPKK
jgi:hypothetical protein